PAIFFFAARLGSATASTLRPSRSASASFAWPTTAIAPSARADASASTTAVAAGVTNNPSSTARLSLIPHVLATRRLDVRRDPADAEQILAQGTKIPIRPAEKVQVS